MSTYAIGDVQGCLEPLKKLLSKIHYDPKKDTLWFVGDLVNRGPHSLETLRFIQQLPKQTKIVLGNHDLGLLAVAQNIVPLQPEDTFQDVLKASDKEELLDWLRSQHILYHDPLLNYTLSHAGIYPIWHLTEALIFAQELEEILRGPKFRDFLSHMYGNTPSQWDPHLTGWERLRFICNAFTRMRFCTPEGELDLTTKKGLKNHPELIPWFAFPHRPTQNQKLIFGHWAALNGQSNTPHIFPLDTGCVWGNCLTAFCLETQCRIQVPCERNLSN